MSDSPDQQTGKTGQEELKRKDPNSSIYAVSTSEAQTLLFTGISLNGSSAERSVFLMFAGVSSNSA